LHRDVADPNRMKLLLLVRDPYPCTRSDLFTLFAERLPEHGIRTDVVAVRHGALALTDLRWPAGRERVVHPFPGPLGVAIAGLLIDVRSLAARGRDVQAVVVRDKVLTGVLALLLSRSTLVSYWMSYPMSEDDTRGAPSCIRAQAPASNIHAATTTTFPGSAST
jgi:hypothetical protein